MTFYEAIDELIDVHKVPDTKKNGDGYENARQLIHEELSNHEDVEVACYHESGHWAYAVVSANQLGIDASQIDVVRPRIEYHPPINSELEWYESTPTGLTLPGTNRLAYTEENVKIMARIAMAGGETVQHFFGLSQKRGDLNDIVRFDAFCKQAHLILGSIIGPPFSYREEAIKEIRRDFSNKRFDLIIRTKATLVSQNQFGSVFALCTKVTL